MTVIFWTPHATTQSLIKIQPTMKLICRSFRLLFNVDGSLLGTAVSNISFVKMCGCERLGTEKALDVSNSVLCLSLGNFTSPMTNRVCCSKGWELSHYWFFQNHKSSPKRCCTWLPYILTPGILRLFSLMNKQFSLKSYISIFSTNLLITVDVLQVFHVYCTDFKS